MVNTDLCVPLLLAADILGNQFLVLHLLNCTTCTELEQCIHKGALVFISYLNDSERRGVIILDRVKENSRFLIAVLVLCCNLDKQKSCCPCPEYEQMLPDV